MASKRWPGLDSPAMRSTVVDRRIDLQRSGQADYLLVFRHRSLTGLSGVAPASVSDNIRIYTLDEDERLRLSFDFQPEPLLTTTLSMAFDHMRHPGRYPLSNGLPLTFQVATVRDLDGNDRPEVLGAYFQRFMEDEDPIPVVLAWSDSVSGYRLYPLLTAPPKLRHLRPGLFGAVKRGQDRLPIFLEDTRGDFAQMAYEVQGFGVTTTASGRPGLVTSFLGRSPSHAEPLSLELKTSVVSYEEAPRTQECEFGAYPETKPSQLVSLRARPDTFLKYRGYFGEMPPAATHGFTC